MPPAVEGLQIRPGTDADIPAVIELMRVALGEGKIPRTREFWLWKHRQNPFGASPMWVAEKDGALVGVRLFLRWKWQHGRRVASAVRAVDTSTHPDFQGAGIFKRLTLALVAEMKEEGVGFVFNTPNEKSRPGYIKMGWVAVGKVPLWILPRRPLQLASTLLKRRDDPEMPGPAASDGELQRVLAELGPDWSSELSRARYQTPANTAYLRWRYGDCPAATYSAAATDPRKAFVIYRERTRRGLRELTLCDLFFERSVQGMRAARAALKLAATRSASDYAITALRPDPHEAAVLASSGFAPAPRVGPILTVRELAGWSGMSDPQKLLSWQASIGDLELF